MKKIAIIGKGKTGGEVLKLLSAEETPVIFDQSHPVSKEDLAACDAAIIFIPGTAVDAIFETVLESKVPTVWGSTGYEWPNDLNARLTTLNTRWVVASNFSLMMVMIQNLLSRLGKMTPALIEEFNCHIHEIHHVHKKDKPSGTALSWLEWVGLPSEITAAREGDVKGIHELTLSTPEETLKIHHDVHDRAVFAKGALWAARYLIAHPELAPGMYPFYNLVNHLFESQI